MRRLLLAVPLLLALAGCDADYYDITTCSLDGGPFERCSSPVRYTNLAPGPHHVVVKVDRYVKDDDGEGHHWTGSDTDEWSWMVLSPADTPN